jgi:hypothetical protein
MAEKVAKLGISQEKDHMLYVKDGAVWRVRRFRPGMAKARPEKVATGGFEMDDNFIYFVDEDGDVSRARRVGGQREKRRTAPTSREPRANKPSPSKQPAAGGSRVPPPERVADPMKSSHPAPELVMNIKREFFAAIVAQPCRKNIEYRNLSDYWLGRLEKVGCPPFKLRLLNGMTPPVPEATIEVTKVERDQLAGELRLHLGRVFEVKHWDRSHERPRR